MDTLDLSTLVLKTGSHTVREAGVCAMEAVAWLAGEPHSDHPVCACPVISSYVRVLNDRMSYADRQKLVAFLPHIIGTAAPEKAQARAELLAWAAIRQFAPIALRAAGLGEHADKLATFEGTLSAAAAYAAYAANAAYAAAYAANAAYAAAYAANAAYAAYAANATYAAAYAAYAANAAANAAYAANAAAYVEGIWEVALAVLQQVLSL